MAATKYRKSVSGDFPQQKVNDMLLSREIDDSAIVTDLSHITTGPQDNPGACDIWFVDVLSAGDETIFDNIVAAHQGTATTSETQTETSWGDSTTTETTYQDKIDKTFDPIMEGTYLISWNFEMKVADGGLGCGVRSQIEAAGVERSEDNWDLAQWHHCNGSVAIDIEEGATPNIKVNYKVLGGGGDTAHIRRSRISLIKQN